jgi:hypothetical protein
LVLLALLAICEKNDEFIFASLFSTTTTHFWGKCITTPWILDEKSVDFPCRPKLQKC